MKENKKMYTLLYGDYGILRIIAVFKTKENALKYQKKLYSMSEKYSNTIIEEVSSSLFQ